MNNEIYQTLRSHCYEDLKQYIDCEEWNALFEVDRALSKGNETYALAGHEAHVARETYKCIDISPRERAAANLLAKISEYRRWAWQREPTPPKGMKQLPPFTPQEAAALNNKTREVLTSYLKFLQDTRPAEAAALLDEYEASLTAAPAAKVGAVPAVKGITKNAVINSFEGLHFNGDQWRKYTASPPEWLERCRVQRGDPKTSGLWNPADIALALLDRKIPLKRLDAVFVGLSDWADEWREKTELERN